MGDEGDVLTVVSGEWAPAAAAAATPLVSRITRATNQTGIANGSYQAVALDSAGTDTAGAANAANSRLVIPAGIAGRWGSLQLRLVLLGTPVFTAGEEVGVRIVRRNSSDTIQEVWEQRSGNSTSSAIWCVVAQDHVLTEGDRYSAQVLYATGVGGRTIYMEAGAESPLDLTLFVR